MKVKFYESISGRSPVEEFIASLSTEDQVRFFDVVVGIELEGLEYRRVVFRHLRAKLWEIKFQAPSGGYRIMYVVLQGDLMIWLHAFKKKSQKTPLDDLRLAERRMKEVLDA